MDNRQLLKITSGQGFIAALDQSGGSTPKALKLYGIAESEYNNASEMFDLIHEMRTRIIKSSAFKSGRILGAILFKDTMLKEIDNLPTAIYLWEKLQIVPFLKIDQGLLSSENQSQLLKPINDLKSSLELAEKNKVFGTKMRSLINGANNIGIKDLVDQQFDIGEEILSFGLLPIIEPEVDITIPDKREAEDMLYNNIKRRLDRIESGKKVILKLSLPEQDNFYEPLTQHPNILRIVALSGGFEKKIAVNKLKQNKNMIASFSRALTEGLKSGSSKQEFEEQLDRTVQSIYEASLS
jgi:fructose-bisphosphate aldolase class I